MNGFIFRFYWHLARFVQNYSFLGIWYPKGKKIFLRSSIEQQR